MGVTSPRRRFRAQPLVFSAADLGLFAVLSLWPLSHRTWWRRTRTGNPTGSSRQHRAVRLQPQSHVPRPYHIFERSDANFAVLARRAYHDRRGGLVSPPRLPRRAEIGSAFGPTV